MCVTNYSVVKYELTEALRQLELLYEELADKKSYFATEVEYWTTTIQLIRHCLYDVKKKYKGSMSLLESVCEIKSEILNTYTLQYSYLSKEHTSKLYFAWLRLEKVEGHLRQ